MRLEANNIIISSLFPTAFDLDAQAQIPTALVEAKLLPEGYADTELQIRSGAT